MANYRVLIEAPFTFYINVTEAVDEADALQFAEHVFHRFRQDPGSCADEVHLFGARHYIMPGSITYTVSKAKIREDQ